MARVSSPPIREEWSTWLQMGTPSLCSTPAAFAGNRLSSTIMCSTRHHNRESLPRPPPVNRGGGARNGTAHGSIRTRPRGRRCDSPRGCLSKPTRPSRRLCGFCLISFSAQDKSRTFVGRSLFGKCLSMKTVPHLTQYQYSASDRPCQSTALRLHKWDGHNAR